MSLRKIANKMQTGNEGAPPSISSTEQKLLNGNGKPQLARDLMTQPELAPGVAYFLYRIFSSVTLPDLKLTVAKKEKRYTSASNISLTCEPSLSFKYNLSMAEIITAASKNTKGLASSLLIAAFLGSSFNKKNIKLYSKTTETSKPSGESTAASPELSFINVEFSTVFRTMWNTPFFNQFGGAPEVIPPSFENPFIPFLYSLPEIELLKDALKNPEFILEKNKFLFRVCFFPFVGTKTFLQNEMGIKVFEFLKKQKAIFLRHALLDDDFRNFLLSPEIPKYADELFAKIKEEFKTLSLPPSEQDLAKIALELKEVASHIPKELAKLVHDNFCKKTADLELFVNNWIQANPTPEARKFICDTFDKIILQLQNAEYPDPIRKDLIKKMVIFKINQQKELKDVLTLVEELKQSSSYKTIRDREGFSLKGTAVKVSKSTPASNNEDENEFEEVKVVCSEKELKQECILPVGARFSEIMHAAKRKMYEIVKEKNNPDLILKEPQLRNFIQSNINGHYWKLDVLDSFGSSTETSVKLKMLKDQIDFENMSFAQQLQYQAAAFYTQIPSALVKNTLQTTKEAVHDVVTAVAPAVVQTGQNLAIQVQQGFVSLRDQAYMFMWGANNNSESSETTERSTLSLEKS